MTANINTPHNPPARPPIQCFFPWKKIVTREKSVFYFYTWKLDPSRKKSQKQPVKKKILSVKQKQNSTIEKQNLVEWKKYKILTWKLTKVPYFQPVKIYF